jgi:hypothetical protein
MAQAIACVLHIHSFFALQLPSFQIRYISVQKIKCSALIYEMTDCHLAALYFCHPRSPFSTASIHLYAMFSALLVSSRLPPVPVALNASVYVDTARAIAAACITDRPLATKLDFFHSPA